MRGSRCYCILCALTGLALAYLALIGMPTAAQAQPPKGPISFINDVAPILKENCFACHDAKKKKGKFEMTSYDTIRKGGTKDDPIMPGKSRESLIIDLLTSTGINRMPPKDAGDALSKEKIAIIVLGKRAMQDLLDTGAVGIPFKEVESSLKEATERGEIVVIFNPAIK